MEYELAGGNMSIVTTDGSIVFKESSPQSDTIKRLLNHLEDKGITFVPKAYGFDDKGRQMLSFMEGTTVDDYPFSSKLEDKITIVSKIANMTRVYHDGTLDFQVKKADNWFLRYNGVLEKEIIAHNDIAPYNVTFIGNSPSGIIDFDVACPAPRIWDIVYALYRFVPLSKEVYDVEIGNYREYDKSKDANERKTLINVFLDAYGMDLKNKIEATLIQRLSALVNLFDEQSEKGNEAFIKMKEDGHQAFYVKEIEFIKEHYQDWI